MPLTVPGTYPTLEDAIRLAPSGAIVVVEPGTYERPKSPLTRPLTLVSRELGGAVIDYNRRTTPGDGKWQSITLPGPGFGGAPKGKLHQAWTWTLPDKRPPATLAYATGAEIPTRLAFWDRKGTDLDTPAGFVEKVRTNRTYTVGWSSFANPDSTTTLYAVFPPGLDPNTLTVTAGELPTSSTASTASLFVVAGPDIRLCGFRLRCGRVTLTAAAHRCTLDHNAFDLSLVKVEGSKPGTYGADHLIEHNTLTETNVWTDDHQHKPAIPWVFIKGGIQNADGSVYASPTGTAYGRLGAGTERTAIWNGGGAHRLVIRRNTIDGFFNGIGGYGSGFDRHATKDNDVYENTIRRIADDAFEPEHTVTNWRAWRNRLEDVCVVLSMGPVNYGPVYLLENTAWKIGPHGTGRTNQGEVGASGKGIKFSGSSVPTARLFLLRNTFWTDAPDGVSGAEQSAGGGSMQEAFYLCDNLLRFTKYAFAAPSGFRWKEAGNHFATTDLARGLSYAGVKFGPNVGDYRQRSGQGQGTNEHASFVDAAWLDAQLEDPVQGNLKVRAGSPLAGKGAG